MVGIKYGAVLVSDRTIYMPHNLYYKTTLKTQLGHFMWHICCGHVLVSTLQRKGAVAAARRAEKKARKRAAKALKAAGFDASQLKGAGFSLPQLKGGGFNLAQLKGGGFDAVQLKGVGFDASLVDAGWALNYSVVAL